jgi:hypothetical protein
MVLNKPIKIVLFFISVLLLISSMLFLVKDAHFFIYKTEAPALILSAKDMGVEDPYQFTVLYFNEKTDKNDTAYITVKKNFAGKINQGGTVNIIYDSNWTKTIYVVDGGNPRIAILLIDIVAIILMYFIMMSNKWW